MGGGIVNEWIDWGERFAERLTFLREKKDVSAREMSLAIGQCHSYINNIESKKNLPSMNAFFYICEYLNVTPKEFFDFEAENPQELREIISDLRGLPSRKLNNIAALVKDLKK